MEATLYGHAGASIFWHYTLMNPDLTFTKALRVVKADTKTLELQNEFFDRVKK